MSDSPKILTIGDSPALGDVVARPGHVLVLMEVPLDCMVNRGAGDTVDLCDPGFEAAVVFALAQAGIRKPGAAGIDELREQRDRARMELAEARQQYYEAASDAAHFRALAYPDGRGLP